MPTIQFWYDFASTYSYLSAMRVEALAARADVVIVWRPFLLGPIFAAQGLNTSPFNLYPRKGAHMWRNLERQCAALGLPLVRPDPFPQNGLTAARIALLARDGGWAAEFSKAVYTAEFGEGRQIADRAVLTAILTALGRDAEAVLAAAESAENKDRLRRETDEADQLGIFGAPSFVTQDGELFWGNDRLEQALHWERHGALQALG